MLFVPNLLQNKSLRRFLIMAILVLILFSIRKILDIILITFIFTFLMDRLQTIITKGLNKWFPVNQKLVVILIYALFVTSLVYGIYKYTPIILMEISQLIRQITEFYRQPQEHEVVAYIVDTIKQIQLTGYMEKGFNFLYKYLTNMGRWGIKFLIALILSLFFLLEKQRIIDFTGKFKNSQLAAFYNELEYFATRFARSFGKVIEVQFLIATINCILSVVALWFLGFPQLFALGLMIFLLGLIPVAGVIISLFPLCTIAFSIGGFMNVIYVLIIIAVIHALESYVLNPKLMSSKTNLPVFYTFMVLIVCEHYFGVWGLIVGIPLFIFLLDVLGIMREQVKSN